MSFDFSPADQIFALAALSVWIFAVCWIKLSNRALSSEECILKQIPLTDLSILLFVLFSTFICLIGELRSNTQSFPLLLFCGIILSQLIESILGSFDLQNVASRSFFNCLIFFAMTVCILQPGTHNIYKFHSQLRWTGIWINPNTSGLCMGLAFVLALGLMTSTIMFKGRITARWSIVTFYIIAMALAGNKLLNSYSRGAWLATFCGSFYIGAHGIEAAKCRLKTNLIARQNIMVVVLGLCSLSLLVFWFFRDTQCNFCERFASVTNMNDFSWRNRIAAWKGALQIIGEQPFFGAGWDRPGRLYERFYLPIGLNESTAFETNDYLVLGASLGIPALFCFVGYLCLLVVGKKGIADGGWSKAVWRAGVIVMLVAFWFDGGLFKLFTATTFWIILAARIQE